MSSWSEIRARSGDALSDSIADLVSRANMSEAITDQITVSDKISHVKILRSKIAVTDTELFSAYARPRNPNQKYYMPFEPDGNFVRMDLKFDHGGEVLTDYSYMDNKVEIGFETEQPTLRKNPEDDMVTAGELCSILDGKQHYYRIPKTDNNSLKKMVQTAQEGFSFTVRVWYVTLINENASGGLNKAHICYYIENDQVEYALKILLDDEAYVHAYLKMGTEYYYVKSSSPLLIVPELSDYDVENFDPENFDTGITTVPIPEVISFTDIGLTFDFTTKEFLIYKNGLLSGNGGKFTTLSDIPNTTALSLWYKINEGTGTNIEDYSGNNLDGTLTIGAGNTAIWQYDKSLKHTRNTTGSYNGSYISRANDTTIDALSEFTIAFWYKPEFLLCDGDFREFTNKGWQTNGSFVFYRQPNTSNIVFEFKVDTTGTKYSTSIAGAFDQLDKWYFIVLRWKTGESIKISVNDTEKTNQSGVITATLTNTTALRITNLANIDGYIKHYMFFKRRIESEEITDLYNTFKPVVETITPLTTVFPPAFADPPPPPPPGTPTQQPFENVMDQTFESAQVKINKVTTSGMTKIYDVAGGAPVTDPFSPKYTVPEGSGSNTTNPYATPPFYSMVGASSTGTMVFGDDEVAYGQYIRLSGSALNGKKLTRLTLELNGLGNPTGGTVWLGIKKANGDTIKFGAGIAVADIPDAWTQYVRTGNQDIPTQYALAVGDGVGVIWEGGTGGTVNIRRTGSHVHQASEDPNGDNNGENSCQAQYVTGVGWTNVNDEWAMAAIMETGGETILASPILTIAKPDTHLIAQQFSTGSTLYNVAPSKLQFKVWRKPGTTGILKLEIYTAAGALKTNGFLKQWVIETEIPDAQPAAGVYNLTWENVLNTVVIGSGERIVLHTPASGTGTLNTGGEVYVMSNKGLTNNSTNNHNSTSSYIVKRNTSGAWATYDNNTALDISGTIWSGGNDFTGYIHLDDQRKRTGIKADTSSSSLVTPAPGKIVTQVIATLKTFGDPEDGAIYCRIRSGTGILRATIGQKDRSQVLGTDTSLTFTNVSNIYPMALDDVISIEYDGGTATDYLMVRINKNQFETTNTILFETMESNLSSSAPVTDRDLAAQVFTGGQIDTAARPMRGIKIKTNSVLIGDPITEARVKLKRTGSFGATEEMSVKIIRGSDKVTVATLGTKLINTISSSAFVEYTFQNTNNSYAFEDGDFLAIENNFGNSTSVFIEAKTSSANVFDSTKTIMFEYNGTTFTEVTGVDLTAQLFIGGFMVFPDPSIPVDPTPPHYFHGWFIASSTTPDSEALINPIYLKPEDYSFSNCILKHLRLFAKVLTPQQLLNYFENRFTTSSISKGQIEVVGHDISGYDTTG